MIKQLFKKFSRSSREKRAKLIWKYIPINKSSKILDLGGGNGKHLHSIIQDKEINDVTIADILETDLLYAQEEFGYKIVKLKEERSLPFEENEFDFVFCNSVIEHVKIPKSDIWSVKDSKEFYRLSFKHQKNFAKEICRISKSYFVQTPNKYFCIESHSWLPGIIVFLPRVILLSVIKFFNLFWFKKTEPELEFTCL